MAAGEIERKRAPAEKEDEDEKENRSVATITQHKEVQYSIAVYCLCGRRQLLVTSETVCAWRWEQLPTPILTKSGRKFESDGGGRGQMNFRG